MITVSTAHPEDIAVLSGIGKRSFLAHFEPLWHCKSEMQHFIQRHFEAGAIAASMAKPDVEWLIVKDGTEATGLCQMNWCLVLDEAQPNGAYINKVYFEPEKTGKGYGAAVFGFIESRSREKGLSYLWLEVLKDNVGATAFYQRQGFEKVKEDVFSGETQQSELWVMQKIL